MILSPNQNTKTQSFPSNIQQILNKMSSITYENLSKIITYHDRKSSEQAMRLPDEFENDVDHYLGGGTCFSLTWYLHHRLQDLGYSTRLILGHKRKQRNVHCALVLEHNDSEFLLDPGYLIFDPLKLPTTDAIKEFFPLKPNWVELQKQELNLLLFTGHLKQKHLRFSFDYLGCSESAFRKAWQDTFHFEMMEMPILNRLENEVQYYWQKDHLVVRTAEDSKIVTFPENEKIVQLSKIFKIDECLIEKALTILEKQS